MIDLRGFTVYEQLRSEAVSLRASARFGDGVAAALWDRNERAVTRYEAPGHHTLSLYVRGGERFRRRIGRKVIANAAEGRLCLMPAGLSTEWEVEGAIRLFHLLIPRAALDRVIVEALGGDPAAVALREQTYFDDPQLEALVRGAILPLDWDEPAERLAASHAVQTALAMIVARQTERAPKALVARGGLAPAVLRRVESFVESELGRPLAIGDLAAVAGLSAFHFARMFKRSTGESPHRFVLRRRVERAKVLIDGGAPLSEVALACGFGGQSHFTARFRDLTGLTPGQYKTR